FLAEACMTAVVAMSRRLSAERLPWRFHFSYAKPRYVEQYWVHLGEDLTFDSQLTMMSLPLEWLHRPWPNASATAGQVAEQASQALLAGHGWPGSFLEDRKSTRLNSSHVKISYAVFCLKKKNENRT